jgi:hypothetical protein
MKSGRNPFTDRLEIGRGKLWKTDGFNDLSDQTDLDEQEGMMHLFEGAVLAIRNPGGHTFPEGTEQQAMEYISLLSLLAYRVQEAKRSRSQ